MVLSIKKRPRLRAVFFNAGNRNRTGTGVTTHRILSPGRLPVPPHQHDNNITKVISYLNDPDGTRTHDLRRDRAAL